MNAKTANGHSRETVCACQIMVEGVTIGDELVVDPRGTRTIVYRDGNVVAAHKHSFDLTL